MQQQLDVLQTLKQPEDDLRFNIDLPFTRRLMDESFLPQFKIPQLEPYDRTADSMDHLENFRTLMLLQRANDTTLYRAFPST